jgi:hypothetical protein
MSLDYLVPFLLGAASLAAWAMLLACAWPSKGAAVREKKLPRSRTWRPERREAYHLPARSVWFALSASLLCALAITLALARWLPMPPLENTLLATLALPLLWPALLLCFVTQLSRPWQFACLAGGAIVMSASVLAPSMGT